VQRTVVPPSALSLDRFEIAKIPGAQHLPLPVADALEFSFLQLSHRFLKTFRITSGRG
jgi:hypothetical protein